MQGINRRRIIKDYDDIRNSLTQSWGKVQTREISSIEMLTVMV